MRHLASITREIIGAVALSTVLANWSAADLHWTVGTGTYIDTPTSNPPLGPSGLSPEGWANSSIGNVTMNLGAFGINFHNGVFGTAVVTATQTGYLNWPGGQVLSPFGDSTLSNPLGAGVVTVWFDAGEVVVQWKGFRVNGGGSADFEIQILAAGNGTTIPYARFLYNNIHGFGSPPDHDYGVLATVSYTDGGAGFNDAAWGTRPLSETSPLVNGPVLDLMDHAGSGSGSGGGGGIGAPEPGTVVLGLAALAVAGVHLAVRRRRA